MISYKNAQEAFEILYRWVNSQPVCGNGTKRILNAGFYLMNPMDHLIQTPWRSWNYAYAREEWAWYLSGDNSAIEIGKLAGKWLEIADWQGKVNSNYGHIWRQNDMLNKVIKMLVDDPHTRKASLSLYDAKLIDTYGKDTVCTYAINFKIIDGKLEMSVVMRSNDLWFGFCNDQYCFSRLQNMVARSLDLEVGRYYHFAQDLHLYPKQFDRDKT
jgi:thymidylate synthase